MASDSCIIYFKIIDGMATEVMSSKGRIFKEISHATIERSTILQALKLLQQSGS